MKLGLAQLNPTVGDLAGNRRRIEAYAIRAAEQGAELVVFPEMALTGYPPMDLLNREGFVQDQLRELEALYPLSRRLAIVLGVVVPALPSGPRHLANAVTLLAGGRAVATQAKTLLPTYDVFDENRYFLPAARRQPALLPGSGVALGLTICEDTWAVRVGYEVDPAAELVAQGARLILNPAASPWHLGKPLERRRMLAELARKQGVPVAFVGQVGGNDELVFDGSSFVVDARGRVRAALPAFQEALAVVDLEAPPLDLAAEEVQEPTGAAQLEAALTLGVHDYFAKQGLPRRAVVGLSGGVDSAVVAHLAVKALGADGVLGILMPGPFSSEHSVRDAEALGRNLGIETRRVDIGPIYRQYLKAFGELFGPQERWGLTGQNIQSRTRGAILMAVSNQENRLVLSTGNKSELSMGYCTLYGDMVGGLAVIGDVYKGDVYALAEQANADRLRIPRSTIEKAPSAELAPDQRDDDDLPPYDQLDFVLRQLIEEEKSGAALLPPPGQSATLTREIERRLDRNEYKRRQGPLVLRTSTKAFGLGRRLPIVHRYPGAGSEPA
jgi:NAD+ synthase (glutamine-hydrolysing)